MTPAENLLATIRQRGTDARDLRDAAHEACHALDANVRGPWERERIHAKLEKICGDRGTMIYYELRARTVEQLVCEDFGLAYDAEKWAGVCYMETLKTMHVALPSVEWILGQIKAHHGRLATRRMVDRIKGLRRRRR